MTKLEQYRKEIAELQAKMDDLLMKIEDIQVACPHPEKLREIARESNRCHKDPLEALDEWEEHYCGLCGDEWVVNSDGSRS